MVRVGISVEGVTEERFIKKVISPYLANKDIDITPIIVGGGIDLAKTRNELKRIANSFDYVTTFYDFYGFKGKIEGETKSSLEQKITENAHDNVAQKLIPYVQMYEFEGLLFSCPAVIEQVLQENGVKRWAEKILMQFKDNPENINDSKKTAPSKRLQEKTAYRKTTHGPNIAHYIGVAGIREKCSGFDEWLNRIENLHASKPLD